MKKDVRSTPLYEEAQALYMKARQPGTGRISDAVELQVSPDGSRAIFAGALMETLRGAPLTRVCEIDLSSAAVRVLTFGPHTDRLPKYSPDGQTVAFLSDRHKSGDFQLYLLDPMSGSARAAARVDGWVEYLHWSPDGTRILLGVAGYGADISGAQGAVTSRRQSEEVATWLPAVETGDEDYRWRRAYVYQVSTDAVRHVNCQDYNIWEVVWCGNSSLAAVVSPGPEEGLWYSARLHIIDLETGRSREVHEPQDQLGGLAACPSGKHLAVVEAMCSDRWLVAGDLRLMDVCSGKVESIETHGVDITYVEWRSDRELLIAGHRGFQTVVGIYSATTRAFTEMWQSEEVSTGGFYVTVSGLPEAGCFAMIAEGFSTAPEIAVVRQGRYQALRSFDLGYGAYADVIKTVERVSWDAPDGLEIQGWLLRPQQHAPHPLIMWVHGGPVWHWRPTWLGRRSAAVLMLIKRGYAIFFPNPRGSSGRGQQFARHVLGEMGGADTYDLLSGLDHLVNRGIADPMRLGVTGASYGGFMTSWLITQDSRFAAAVPVAPHTNQVTQHLISNIPNFVALFLSDSYANPGGKYYRRSPIMYAHRVRVPTLNVCGALDRCTPPEEAMQFHNALLENGVRSVLVTYPEEGHGVRNFPAAMDYAARLVAWFQDHMPATAS